MNEPKFTPGPWRESESKDKLKKHISGGHWLQFARVFVGTQHGAKEEGEANLRLIFAAPELYASLAGIFAHYKLSDEHEKTVLELLQRITT